MAAEGTGGTDRGRDGGRPAKEARLALHKRGYWFVLDRGRQVSCKVGGDRAAAEAFLRNYQLGRIDVSCLSLRPIIEKGLAGAGPLPNGDSRAWIWKRLLDFWSGMTVRDFNNEATCRRYHAYSCDIRGADPAAGRDSTGRIELKELRSRVRELCKRLDPDYVVDPWMPEEGAPRERFLFADEIWRLVHVALGRIVDPGAADGWKRTVHGTYAYRDAETRQRWAATARLIMIGAHTASRLDAMMTARWTPGRGHGHLDLAAGVFYRSDAEAADAKKKAPPVPLHRRLHLFLVLCRARDRLTGVDLVVHGVKGGGTNYERPWSEVCAAAGIEDVTRHDLRRSAATLLMADGASEEETARFLGVSVPVLMMHYVQAHARMTARVADLLDQAARGVPTEVSLARAKPRRCAATRITGRP